MRLLVSLGLLSLWTCSFAAAPAYAKDIHDVAGFYSVKTVSDLGAQVRVTLEIRLANSGDADLSSAKVSLRSSLPAGKDHEAIAPVALRPHGNASFTQDFTISRREYEMWRKGARPMLSMKAQAAGGKTLTRTIRLLPIRAGEAK